MKISITKDTKRILTVEEMELARKIIMAEKDEDSMTVEEYAKMAVEAVIEAYGHDWCEKILEASAEIAKNCRVWNYYHDDSRDLDVWIKCIAQTTKGFCIVGACLSDIWSIGPNNRQEIVRHMYIRRFKEV